MIVFFLVAFMVAFIVIKNVSSKSTVLTVKYKTIKVNGRSKKVATIEQPDGTWGYYGKAGTQFDVIVKNELDEPTSIHWHGLILPNDQDGVAGITQEKPIGPGEEYHYQFPFKQSGTYWMHSHHGLQEQEFVEAPLIIETPEDENYQQVVIVFQDFSFKSPEQILKNLLAPHAAPMTMDSNMDMDMSEKTMDLNDVQYDAYLSNYQSPEHPQITQVKAGEKIKLRFINGASASNFWINLGNLKGTLVAVDGQEVQPMTDNKFQLAMAQRLDIIVTIPPQGGTFPILGQVEGLKDQTGIILSTSKNPEPKVIDAEAKEAAPALNDQQELTLHPLNPVLFSSMTPTSILLVLTGNMQRYEWAINGEMWPNITPIHVKQGQLVVMTLQNKSMMAHPMHLHGYDFKVISINGQAVNGALHDTILVLPNTSVTVEFMAEYPGKWMLHCHTLYHMAAGMMTYLEVDPN